MKRIEELSRHPHNAVASMAKTILSVSNSPEFIAYWTNKIAEAARLDLEDDKAHREFILSATPHHHHS